MKITFIGTGVMGGAMAGRLMAAGHDLTVYNRTKAKAEALIRKGARWAETAEEAAADAEVVITMVGFPKDVESVYFGEEAHPGIIEAAPAGALLIDMTTTSPSLSVRIAKKAAMAGLSALDAPVSGGDVGARAGTLSIMVGGDPAAFEKAQPLLKAMGSQVVYEGGPDSGQHTKMKLPASLKNVEGLVRVEHPQGLHVALKRLEPSNEVEQNAPRRLAVSRQY